MFSEYDPGPIDSSDAYMMGLRPARCNGCKYAQLKHELGDKFLSLNYGWFNVYELDAKPHSSQEEPKEYKGRPIRFHASFLSIDHSDECYHWKPPTGEKGWKPPERKDNECIF